MFKQAVHLSALHLRPQVRLRTYLRLQCASITLTLIAAHSSVR